MRYGQALVETDRADEALGQFRLAVALAPDDAQALLWTDATKTYLAGRNAQQTGDWEMAIQAFADVWEAVPGYYDVFSRLIESYRRQGQEAAEAGDWTSIIESLTAAHKRVVAEPAVEDLIAQAYRERGIQQEDEGHYELARLDLEAALALRPDDDRTQTHLDQVMYKLFPPKRIEIDISKQRLYAWEGDTRVHNFVVSTGLPGQDTATGHFEVLDKIPMAYSSIWRLSMPHWLGIYYVGRVENGIHALPIRPDGSVMWGGLLGQRASYGCIILSNKNAKTLYKWAEVGTKVDIHN
jgi:lipoprotein-anchoring transpeptidase ErfK/SrfK